MDFTMQPYADEEDYWRIRAFLRELFLLNDRRLSSWHVGRLDYWRWHVVENCRACPLIEKVIFIWETHDGRIAAVLNPADRSEAFLQVHPHWREPGLLEEMVEVAERNYPTPKGKLWVLADSRDVVLQELLLRREYIKQGLPEHQWRRDFYAPVPSVSVPHGYAIRSLGEAAELPARSWASWRAFHPDEPNERYEGWEWYRNIQRMPLYRRDLDVVATTLEGEIASFCTAWYDDATRSATFDPVGTVPEHQRRGLARAVLTEALRRLRAMGATQAFVSGYEPGPNALYASVMGGEHDLSEPWMKEP